MFHLPSRHTRPTVTTRHNRLTVHTIITVNTVTPSHPSHRHTVTPSHPSYRHTVTPSYRHTVIPVTLSYLKIARKLGNLLFLLKSMIQKRRRNHVRNVFSFLYPEQSAAR
ncbi:hypothetical protein BV898_15546 [Hypsibius exemplaris]|uniref:Uncharacterized protein n=1 Tax=Hypsibius exemplaris TaxID=2072580 RepID=A0A9X6ND06_HYPEX|nr:hypothetical protein BV898_15546 [Hypsibius exemplaris]